MSVRLAVFGFGNIGQAVVIGALHAQVLTAQEIAVIEPDEQKRADAAKLGCVVGTDASLARDATEILLAVKPQSFSELATSLRGRTKRTVFISVMAGLSSARILDAVGTHHAVVRAMPNTPCKIGAGMTGLAIAAGANEGDDALALQLFNAVGHVVPVEEHMLDAVTATSGSGPAYLFLFTEAWEDAAIALGFDRTTARELVRQTITGAARMLDDRAIDSAETHRIRYRRICQA